MKVAKHIKIDNFSLSIEKARVIKLSDWEKMAKGKLKTMSLDQSFNLIKSKVKEFSKPTKVEKKKSEKKVIQNKAEKPVENNKSEK